LESWNRNFYYHTFGKYQNRTKAGINGFAEIIVNQEKDRNYAVSLA